jgi:hypothetical protein
MIASDCLPEKAIETTNSSGYNVTPTMNNTKAWATT